jgi:hypothetical protein
MSSLKNALEDVVIREAQKQLAAIYPGINDSGRLADVVVYVLNRLPPLYATSSRGWEIQRRRLLKEFRNQIIELVARAIKHRSRQDRRCTDAPLPEIELKSTARALVSLRKLLGQADLRWRDVPTALMQAMGIDANNADRLTSIDRPTNHYLDRKSSSYGISRQVMAGEQPGVVTVLRSPEDTDIQEDDIPQELMSPGKRAQIEQLKAYLARTRENHSGNTTSGQANSSSDRYRRLRVVKNANGQELSAVDMEAQQLEIYTLSAKLEFSNVLEKLVLLVAGHLTRNFEPQVRSQINLAEVTAYALNRLPPMYASSDCDYRYQRQRAQSQKADQITALVKQGIDIVLINPSTNHQPLPFEKFNQEYDQVLPQIKLVLKCRNVNLSNVATIAADIIKFKRQSRSELQNSDRVSQTNQAQPVAAAQPQAMPKVVGGYYQPTAAMYS